LYSVSIPSSVKAFSLDTGRFLPLPTRHALAHSRASSTVLAARDRIVSLRILGWAHRRVARSLGVSVKSSASTIVSGGSRVWASLIRSKVARAASQPLSIPVDVTCALWRAWSTACSAVSVSSSSIRSSYRPWTFAGGVSLNASYSGVPCRTGNFPPGRSRRGRRPWCSQDEWSGCDASPT
jgi:hypothetical protein